MLIGLILVNDVTTLNKEMNLKKDFLTFVTLYIHTYTYKHKRAYHFSREPLLSSRVVTIFSKKNLSESLYITR